MSWVPGGTFNLQHILSSGSAGDPAQPIIVPHHPITCPQELSYHEDTEVLECSHAKTERHDPRTRSCLNSSMAYLLIELATKL